MIPLSYSRAQNARDAFSMLAQSVPQPVSQLAPQGRDDKMQYRAQYLAGGTTLIDLMKLDVMKPVHLVDINPLGKSESLSKIELREDGLHLGGMVTMAQAAEDQTLKQSIPMLTQSLQLSASAQIRNMASLAGNVLQRTRCTYFRDHSFAACNKRSPGSGCAAIEGVNRQHAVLGVSDQCIATYPGDFAQSLIAADAKLEITGPKGQRTIAFADLHREPGTTPHVETVLAPDELITGFLIPTATWLKRSAYVKVRDRASYSFALTSAAVALDLTNGRVSQARIALGGVATKPWRANEAEAALIGQMLDEDLAAKASGIAFSSARARKENAFKIDLGKQTLIRALLQVASMEI